MSDDIVEDTVTLLTDNWNAANTDSITPTIEAVYKGKRRTIVGTPRILVYSTGETQQARGIGNAVKRKDHNISIDLRSITDPQVAARDTITEGRTHAIKLRKEIERILDTKVKNPTTEYQELAIRAIRDLCDRSTHLFRFVFEITFIDYSTVRST